MKAHEKALTEVRGESDAVRAELAQQTASSAYEFQVNRLCVCVCVCVCVWSLDAKRRRDCVSCESFRERVR
jgi:hypothetical protein